MHNLWLPYDANTFITCFKLQSSLAVLFIQTVLWKKKSVLLLSFQLTGNESLHLDCIMEVPIIRAMWIQRNDLRIYTDFWTFQNCFRYNLLMCSFYTVAAYMYFACVHYLIERNYNYIDTSSANSTDLHGLTSVQNLQHDIL